MLTFLGKSATLPMERGTGSILIFAIAAVLPLVVKLVLRLHA